MIKKTGLIPGKGPVSLFSILLVFTLYACIDPFSPHLTGYESLLVVDGLVTDANASNTVKLSRTFQEQNSEPVLVSDATVYISDDSGNKYYFANKGKGVYKTDSLQFKGSIGRTYVLHVSINTGEEYESEPCTMQSVPDIDSIYAEADQKVINNGTQVQKGAQIYINSKEGDYNQYYRWSFDETWKFKVPNAHKYEYFNDSTILPVTDVKEFGWKNSKSKDILIQSVYDGQSPRIMREPVFFIASEQSDRLLIQYSILINQYSISKVEYDFWNNMKSINENGGDIFAKQPFSVSSNVHNINDTKQRVLGYFQVSAVRQKRMNLPFNEMIKMGLPFYHYPCTRIEKAPSDFQKEFGPVITWDDVYRVMSITSSYSLVEPLYIPGTLVLSKLVFTTPECSNSELTGTRKKPDFWIDMN